MLLWSWMIKKYLPKSSLRFPNSIIIWSLLPVSCLACQANGRPQEALVLPHVAQFYCLSTQQNELVSLLDTEKFKWVQMTCFIWSWDVKIVRLHPNREAQSPVKIGATFWNDYERSIKRKCWGATRTHWLENWPGLAGIVEATEAEPKFVDEKWERAFGMRVLLNKDK